MRIARLGPFARRFLECHETARVSAVFARSFHLAAGDDALCVVDAALGDGALNAVLSGAFDPVTAPPAEAIATIAQGRMRIGDRLILPFEEAIDWRPPPAHFRPEWRGSLIELKHQALARAPRDGAYRAALDHGFRSDVLLSSSQLQNPLVRSITKFCIWFDYTINDRSAPGGTAPVAGLVGLGPGLTPAGDDFLAGLMVASRAMGKPQAAEAVARAVEALGAGATTVLSRSMLRAAGEGCGGAALHHLLAAIGASETRRIAALIDEIDNIGHTSGWDALAGAIIALGFS